VFTVWASRRATYWPTLQHHRQFALAKPEQIADRELRSVDAPRRAATLDDGPEFSYDLFRGSDPRPENARD